MNERRKQGILLLFPVMVLLLGIIFTTTLFYHTYRQIAYQHISAFCESILENKGKTVTRRQLLEEIWDNSGNYVNDNTLTVTMKRLREKLHHPLCLKTIRSFGYRMEDTK